MLSLQRIFIYYLIAINAVAYLFMWYDKNQAKKKGQRISENALLIIAVVFGTPGIYLGMKTPIYHKAGKPKFKILIPCLMLLQCVLLLYLHQKLGLL